MEIEEVYEVSQNSSMHNFEFRNAQETVNHVINKNKKRIKIVYVVFIVFTSIIGILAGFLYDCTKRINKKENAFDSILDETVTAVYSFNIPNHISNSNVESTINLLVQTIKNSSENIGYEWFMTKENNTYVGGNIIERYKSFQNFIDSKNISQKWNALHYITDMMVFNVKASDISILLEKYPFAMYMGKRNFGFSPCFKKGRETASDLITILYKFSVNNESKTSDELLNTIIGENIQDSLQEAGTIGYEWFLNKNKNGNYKGGYILERYSSFGAFVPSHTPPGRSWKIIQTPIQITMFNIPYYGKYILEEGGWGPFVKYMGSGMRYFGYSVCGW